MKTNSVVASIQRISTRDVAQEEVEDFAQNRLHICVPARVMKVGEYETYQVVDVRPVLDTFYPDDDITLNAPIIRRVFVRLISSGGFSIKMPVEVGDLCTLHWTDKDLDIWLNSNGAINKTISNTNTANLEDCYVELGFGTRRANQSPSESDLIIEGPATTITITPDGTVTVNTQGKSFLTSSHHTINTDVTIKGNVDITGNTVNDGTITSKIQMMAPSYTGYGSGTSSMQIGTIHATSDVTVDGDTTVGGISYLGHRHTDGDGETTTAPF